MCLRNKFLIVLCCVALACCAMEQRVYVYDAVSALNFSSDGGSLIVGLANGSVLIVDRQDVSVQKKVHLYDVPVSVVAFDGGSIVIGYSDGTVHLKPIDSNAYATFKEHTGFVTAVTITRGCIVTGSSDGSICIRNNFGSLLKKMRVSAGVSVMHVSSGAGCLFIGCDDGAVWHYNIGGDGIEQLVQDLRKGKVLCVLGDAQGFYVAYDNTDMVYFNLMNKATKTFKARCPIYALQLIPEDGIIAGYNGNGVQACAICDTATGYVYRATRATGGAGGPVVVRGNDVAMARETYVGLSNRKYHAMSWFIQFLADGLQLKKLVIKDKNFHECAHLKGIGQNRYYRARVFLWTLLSQKGFYVEPVDVRGRRYTFYAHDTLESIDRLVVARDIAHGELSCVYRPAGKWLWKCAYAAQQVEPKSLPIDTHMLLYSLNIPLVDAHLIVRFGTSAQRIVQGFNMNGAGGVWIFEDTQSAAPYMLKLFSYAIGSKAAQRERGALCEVAHTPGQSAPEVPRVMEVYTWHIPYLARDSEFFVQRLFDGRVLLRHIHETTGLEVHCEAPQCYEQGQGSSEKNI
jgi:hypothetical protein